MKKIYTELNLLYPSTMKINTINNDNSNNHIEKSRILEGGNDQNIPNS